MRRKLHQTIRKLPDDFESRWHFNTSIAAIMELVNELYANEAAISNAAMREALGGLTLLLSPFAPYLAQELQEELGTGGEPVFQRAWPEFDTELAREEGAEIVVQVNGRVRGRLFLPFGTARETVEKAAFEEPKVRPFVDGKQVVKVVLVPDKLVNIVVK